MAEAVPVAHIQKLVIFVVELGKAFACTFMRNMPVGLVANRAELRCKVRRYVFGKSADMVLP